MHSADFLTTGFEHHRAGRLAQAESCYRRVLETDSNNLDALYLLGVVANQKGETATAVELISRAITLNSHIARLHSSLGNVLRDQGRLADAIACYRRALVLQPESGQTFNELGHTLRLLGESAEAASCFRRAVVLEPELVQAHYNLGATLQESGKSAEAKKSYRRALLLAPEFTWSHFNLGIALQALDETFEAEICFRRALELEPDLAQAHYSLGVALLALGKSGEADASFRRALTISPDYAAAHFSMGIIQQERGQLSEAEGRYRRALEIEPHYAEAHNNLASVVKGLGKPAQAEFSYRAALALMPEFAEAHFNLGIVLQELNRHLEATVCYQRAIALKPEHIDAHVNLSVALLLLGRLEEGWLEYEWRCRVRDYGRNCNFGRPVWNGEAGDGLLLLHTEQGMGDTIQFCRYASLAATRKRVTLQAPRSLVRLLSNLAGVEQLIVEGTSLPDFEVSCPLLSLPRLFNTTLETIPGAAPYLAAETERVLAWRTRLPDSGFRIGIAWAGSPRYKADRGRSAPLNQWAPLARIPGVQLISLQKDYGLDQLGQLPRDVEVHSLGGDFDCGADAFLDTAAVMMNLDLIIAVDTAVAHLAGALGRPVWLAVSALPHWVWMLSREDSPWYPTMRLFRQISPGDWTPVFERMASELACQLGARERP